RSKLRALICPQRYIKTYLKSALDFTTVLFHVINIENAIDDMLKLVLDILELCVLINNILLLS
ncbi:MAG: hypothetical protein M0O93_01825, partial [Bacteroidales bacterium]|nr:hypothetical protein [Bacteroidales bacterium]